MTRLIGSSSASSTSCRLVPLASCTCTVRTPMGNLTLCKRQHSRANENEHTARTGDAHAHTCVPHFIGLLRSRFNPGADRNCKLPTADCAYSDLKPGDPRSRAPPATLNPHTP